MKRIQRLNQAAPQLRCSECGELLTTADRERRKRQKCEWNEVLPADLRTPLILRDVPAANGGELCRSCLKFFRELAGLKSCPLVDHLPPGERETRAREIRNLLGVKEDAPLLVVWKEWLIACRREMIRLQAEKEGVGG